MDVPNIFRIAHNLNDSRIVRSRDVESAEDISFNDLLLSQETHLGLEQCGFERPSPIQLATIPIGRCGFDLIIQSKAGTGKTCIFAVIALEALRMNKTDSFTQTLIVAPTREIAIQIHDVLKHLGTAYKYLKCALCIGGVEVKLDRTGLKCGSGASQIVVGTPGRLKHLIELNVLKTEQVELLVLDEADKLMDEQFKNQIDEIYKRLPKDKQMIVTSATYPNELSLFLQRYMKGAKSIRIGEELSLEAIKEYYYESPAGCSSKKTLQIKFESLKLILGKFTFNKCFVFTNFQARAPLICDNLNQDAAFLEENGLSSYICAELSQEERNMIFTKFRNSSQKILVSTDISARGIDIQEIELVVNFDIPSDNTTYYHRIGRAGRFGQSGIALSIVSNDSLERTLFEKKIKTKRIMKLSFNDM